MGVHVETCRLREKFVSFRIQGGERCKQAVFLRKSLANYLIKVKEGINVHEEI
ncbi:MAG: hypothetical protein ACOY9Y_15060 [Bacillota bacterium]